MRARWQSVRDRVRSAAQQAGRPPESCQLIAVSKTHPPGSLRAAGGHGVVGQLHFGENYAQELRDKADALEDRSLRWHAIGHLQRNKLRYVVGRVHTLHSLDSLRLAQAVSQRAQHLGLRQRVLVGVNLGAEGSKSGIAASSALDLCQEISSLPGASPVG